MVTGCIAALDVARLLHLLPSGGATGLIRIDEISNGASETWLEDDAGQSEQGELTTIPIGHAAHVDIRVACEFAELELLALGGTLLGDPVHNERGLVVIAQHLNLVPVSVVQLASHCYDLRSPAQVVAQSECTLDKLQLEEVIGAAIICIKDEAIRLLCLELQLQSAIQASIPFAKGVERILRAVQLKASANRYEAGHEANQERRHDQHSV